MKTYIHQIAVSLNRLACAHKTRKTIACEKDKMLQLHCKDCGKITYEKTFTPSFKESVNEDFYYSNNEWIKCTKKELYHLHMEWINSDVAVSYGSGDGFTIYGFKD